MPHDDCLDKLVIIGAEEELGSLSLWISLLRVECERTIGTIGNEEFTDILGKGLDKIKICYKILVYSILYLGIAKLLVSMRLKEGNNL
jgi:hypothetical protein